jgi:hypothetical protein
MTLVDDDSDAGSDHKLKSPVCASPFTAKKYTLDHEPTSAQLMEQFAEIYAELQSRLNKGIALGKELKLEQKLRESSNSFVGVLGPRMSTADGDFLDLKAEVTNLKHKLFMADQKRMEDLSAKNVEMTKLDSQLHEEQRRFAEELSKRDKRIMELERGKYTSPEMEELRDQLKATKI